MKRPIFVTIFRLVGAAASIGLLASAGRAQEATWVDCSPAISPSPRAAHGLAYDEARREVVLFGGLGGDLSSLVLFGDTWTYDGVQWKKLTPATNPSPRGGAALAYDAGRRRVVMFGGLDDVVNPHDVAETWEWDGTTWILASPAVRPRARANAALAYDSTRRRIVMFGGATADNEPLDDTWEWDGSSWVEIPSPLSPSPRFAHAMAYDSARRRLVLHGGAVPTLVDDTWEWNGTRWHPMAAFSTPGGQANGSLVYDSAARRCVLFGGRSDGGTWAWDGEGWTALDIAPGPSSRNGHDAVYDTALGRMIVFGGFDGTSVFHGDTWELVPGGFSGSVGSASGKPADVLFANDLSSGDACGTPVLVPRGAPIEIRLDASPYGPDPARYAIWIWPNGPTRPTVLRFGASRLGTLANPSPFEPFAAPQPARCLSGGLPSAFCAGAAKLLGPVSAPFAITRPGGLPAPAVFTLQGLLEDDGATNGSGFSVTNAVILRIL